MATKDPNTPDNVTHIEPGKKTPIEEKAAPDKSAPEKAADKTAASVQEDKAALRDIGKEQPKSPAPSDIGDERKPGDGLRITGVTFIKGAEKETGKAVEPDKADAPPAPDKKSADAEKSTEQSKPDKPDKNPKPEKSTANQSEKDSKLKQEQKPRAPVSPEYAKALAEYNKANAKYKKDLDKWANQQPGENIKQPAPPIRPEPPKAPKKEAVGGKQKPADKAKTPAKEETPPAPKEPEKPPVPIDATRNGETEQIVYLNLSELHAFKNHPFGVRDDSEMKSLVESVKNGGVNQPALVRPRDGGGYEIVAGHRRQKASELAGYANMPCIIRNMTDDEAILAMTDDNLRQRSEILPSEKAISLKMQVDAIKHQGTRATSGHDVQKNAGQRSVDIVGERNGINAKQVQRYVKLTELVPDLLKAVDAKKIGFTQAVELAFIKPENQNLIAVSMDGEQSAPSQSQAKRMRELDGKGLLTGDVIDGILSEQKKEVDKVIISSEELNKYFGKEKTPQQMKEQIIKLLDDWSGKEKAHTAPEKKADR